MKSRKKYISESAFIAIAMTISLFAAGVISAYSSQKHLEGSLVRLHILANSDSDSDQELKLMVRDAILAHSDELFEPYSSSDEAVESLSEKLTAIEKIAESTLLEHNCCDKAHAELVKMSIDERIYGEYTVPEGSYTALRVTLGSGEGKNWWCVMYPPLCIPCAGSELSDEEIMELYGGELTESDMLLLTNGTDFKMKLYIVELIKKLFG